MADPAPVTTAAQTDAKAQLDKMLADYGLESLQAWTWAQIERGRSVEEILPLLYETDQFKARFPALAERRAKGLSPISPADYISYEAAARQAMRMANLPAGFWDHNDDFDSLIANDISIDELNTRITNGYQKVAQAPQTVRDAYRSYFGVNGDAALAAQFLDPTQAASVLDHQVRQAAFGGYGAEHGWNISAGVASSWANRNLSDAEVEAGFGKADALKPLLAETATESDDLGLHEALGTAFGTYDTDQLFQQRLDARKAHDRGSGAAAATDTGVSGLGQAWP